MDTIQPNPTAASQNLQNPQAPQIPTIHHSVLPIILIILGVLEAIFASFYLISLIIITPKLTQLYQEINAKPSSSPYQGVVVLSVIVLLAISQIIYGFKLKKINKDVGSLPSKHRKIAIGILIFILLIVLMSTAVFVYSSILPIYNLTTAF